MCASSQPLASAIGVSILNAGGSAADACVAMAAALNVTEPTSTGLGGDVFVLYFQASDQRVYALNGSGRAPTGLNLDRLRKEGLGQSLPPAHPYTITVPGACAAWVDLLERFGRLSLATVLAPAHDLAEKGFPVAPITAYFWDRAAQNLLAKSINGQELTLEGRGPHAGELFRNPGLARTLRTIAEGGKTAYYQGEIGRAIAAVVKQAGGCLTEADLAAAHQYLGRADLRRIPWNARVGMSQPNGQGLAALIALNLLNGFDLSGQEPLGCRTAALDDRGHAPGFCGRFSIYCRPRI